MFVSLDVFVEPGYKSNLLCAYVIECAYVCICNRMCICLHM